MILFEFKVYIGSVIKGIIIKDRKSKEYSPSMKVVFISEDDENFYTNPYFDSEMFGIEYLKGKMDIVVSVEHLPFEIKKFISIDLNDDLIIGNLLFSLGIVREKCIHRLGDSLYILRNVEKEFVPWIYEFLERVYINSINKYKSYRKDI